MSTQNLVTSALLWVRPPADPPQAPSQALLLAETQQADYTCAHHWLALLPDGVGLRALQLPAPEKAA